MAVLIAWILIFGMAALSAVAIWQKYGQVGVLSGGTAIIAGVSMPMHLQVATVVVLCALWTAAFAAVVMLKPDTDLWATLGILILGVGFLSVVALQGHAPVSSDKASSPAATTQNVGGNKAKDAASAGTGTAPELCNNDFKQDWQKNPNYRVIDDGL